MNQKARRFESSELAGKDHAEKLPCRNWGKEWDPILGPAAWELAMEAACCLPESISDDQQQSLHQKKCLILRKHLGTETMAQNYAGEFWQDAIMPELESRFRDAIKRRDGAFFRALAFSVEHMEEKKGSEPRNPLQTWISRLFMSGRYQDGTTKTLQRHENLTSGELLALYSKETGNRVGLNEFTRELRREGVVWRKSPGGAPLKKTTAFRRGK